MSFIRTLATLAIGFAAAKGVQKYQSGGMAGIKDSLRSAGAPGGMADQIGSMAEKMGLPGGTATVRDAFSKMGGAMASGTETAEAGLGGLIASMTGAAAVGSGKLADMMGALTGDTAAPPMMEANARLMIRAMIQASKADGMIDDEEKAKIMEHLADASPEELAFVEAEFGRPMDIAALAAETDAAMRAQVYATSLMAIRVDTDAERAYLAQLATALGLDAATRDGLHAQMGVAA